MRVKRMKTILMSQGCMLPRYVQQDRIKNIGDVDSQRQCNQ